MERIYRRGRQKRGDGGEVSATARERTQDRETGVMPSERRCANLPSAGGNLPTAEKMSTYIPNCWRALFHVLPKKTGWQVDLGNYWRCSNEPRGEDEAFPFESACSIVSRANICSVAAPSGLVQLAQPSLGLVKLLLLRCDH